MPKTKTEFNPQIELRDPTALTPYHKNTRRHSQQQIDKLAGAIAEFEFDVPIVVDAKGVVIKGHARREAAIRLGLKQVPIIVRSDLTPAQVKAARMADNRIAAEGRDDYEAIALELEELDDLGYDLSLTGFDPAEIDNFLDDEGVEVEPPEVFGESPQSPPGQGAEDAEPQDEGLDDAESESDEPKAPRSPQEKYPLAIVLTSGQKAVWDGLKEVLGVRGDTDALLKIMELGVRLDGK